MFIFAFSIKKAIIYLLIVLASFVDPTTSNAQDYFFDEGEAYSSDHPAHPSWSQSGDSPATECCWCKCIEDEEPHSNGTHTMYLVEGMWYMVRNDARRPNVVAGCKKLCDPGGSHECVIDGGMA